jgi:hypothetical protein
MKKIILLALCLGFSAITFAQSTIAPANAGVTYGKAVTADNALTAETLNTTLSKDSVYNGKITGTVVEV